MQPVLQHQHATRIRRPIAAGTRSSRSKRIIYNPTLSLQLCLNVSSSTQHGDHASILTNCFQRDGGSLDDFLQTVVGFLHSHPTEVVTLLFVNTGPPLRDWAKAFYTTKADLISYVPPRWKWGGRMHTSDWPTPADMVQANKRLIVFMSSGANQRRVPFLLPEFDYIFETNFWISNPNEYQCQPSRPRWPGSFIPDRLSLVDHFLYAEFLGISR